MSDDDRPANSPAGVCNASARAPPVDSSMPSPPPVALTPNPYARVYSSSAGARHGHSDTRAPSDVVALPASLPVAALFRAQPSVNVRSETSLRLFDRAGGGALGSEN
jgi:hypothetical protein